MVLFYLDKTSLYIGYYKITPEWKMILTRIPMKNVSIHR